MLRRTSADRLDRSPGARRKAEATELAVLSALCVRLIVFPLLANQYTDGKVY
jgi:hypothetical protein